MIDDRIMKVAIGDLELLKLMWNSSARFMHNDKKFITTIFIYNYLIKHLGRNDDSAFFDTNIKNGKGMIGNLIHCKLIVSHNHGFLIL